MTDYLYYLKAFLNYFLEVFLNNNIGQVTIPLETFLYHFYTTLNTVRGQVGENAEAWAQIKLLRNT